MHLMAIKKQMVGMLPWRRYVKYVVGEQRREPANLRDREIMREGYQNCHSQNVQFVVQTAAYTHLEVVVNNPNFSLLSVLKCLSIVLGAFAHNKFASIYCSVIICPVSPSVVSFAFFPRVRIS